MALIVPGNIRLRNALASPPPAGATLASVVLFSALSALLAMLYAGAEWYYAGGGFGFSSDLAWTRAVFARNLAAGSGLAFNPGAPTAGVAAPAWVGALAIGGFLTGSLFGAKLLGVICISLTAFLVWRVTLDLLGDWRFAFLASLLVAASPRLLAEALGGSEGALAALLLTAAIYWQAIGWAGTRKQRIAAVFAAALAALSRPELVLLLPLLALDRWLISLRQAERGRRLRQALSRSLPELIGAGLVLAPYLLYNWRAGGPLWQQPEVALRAQPPLRWAVTALSSLWASQPIVFCAALLGLPVAALAAARPTARHPSFLLVLAPLVVLLAPGLIWRFADSQNAVISAAALAPIISVLGTAGLFLLYRALGRVLLRGRKRISRLAYGAAIGLVVIALSTLTWFAHRQAWQRHGLAVRKVNDLQVYLGQWAAPHTAPDATIATRDVGAIAYFSRRKMLDLGGRVDQFGLSYLRRPGSPDTNLLAVLQQTHPSYVAIRPSDFPDLSQRVDLLTPTVTCGFRDPITGGVTTWVLYETPWPAPSARAARREASAR